MSLAFEIDVACPSYEIAGPPGAPVIAVLGGISADRHVCATDQDPREGWWESVAGAHRPIDTTRYQLLGFDFLDGGCGNDGRPERIVTTHDQAIALAAILDELGIDRLHAVVGASYGGMVALAFAERYPDRLERLVVIGAAHRTHPMITAQRAIQRGIVDLGLETGRTRDALAIARSLAITTYRTAHEFTSRFAVAPVTRNDRDAVFPVESYLTHQGERFANSWCAHRFLALSLSGDLHSVDPSSIHTPAVLVAAEGDSIVPRHQLEELARELAAPSRLIDLPGIHGHDAFLTEPVALGCILDFALSSSILS